MRLGLGLGLGLGLELKLGLGLGLGLGLELGLGLGSGLLTCPSASVKLMPEASAYSSSSPQTAAFIGLGVLQKITWLG